MVAGHRHRPATGGHGCSPFRRRNGRTVPICSSAALPLVYGSSELMTSRILDHISSHAPTSVAHNSLSRRRPASTVTVTERAVTITLGKHAAPVPDPFAGLLREHLSRGPNLRTGTASSPWLFPGTRAGQHLHPNTMMVRLRRLGVDLLGARNRALSDLVTEVPAPLVADALGYSHQVTVKHADAAAASWSRYVGHRA